MINCSNKELCTFLQKQFLPESILVAVENRATLQELSQLPFFSGKEFVNDRTQVYVCKDFTCSLPLESIKDVEKLL